VSYNFDDDKSEATLLSTLHEYKFSNIESLLEI